MIRVLHILGGLNLGGAESRIMDIYRKIDRNQIQFDFLIHKNVDSYFEDEVVSLGGKIFYLPERKITRYFKYRKKLKIFFQEKNQIDIIHAHSLSSSPIYFKLAKKYGYTTTIAHSRSGNSNEIGFMRQIKQILKRIGANKAKYKFAVSDLAAISAFGKKNLDKVNIIPNAIDVKKYKFDLNTRDKLKKEFDIRDESVILHIGRFEKQKNHIFILKTFKQILERNPKTVLLLVGRGHLQEKMKELAQKLNISSKVKFLGARDDVSALMSAADVLFFPSHFEGLPGVVLESQASGLKVIMSNTITKQVILTDLVKVIDLKNQDDWINFLSDIDNSIYNRTEYNDILIKKGFDIKDVTDYYFKFYQSITMKK